MASRTVRALVVAAAASIAGAGTSFALPTAAPDGRAAGIVRLAADEDGAAAYRKRTAERIDEWKAKVEDYSRDAKAKGTAAGEAAADKVDRAWDGVKTQWSRLQDATDDSWADTKAAFEKAWRDFQDTWKSATSRS